MKYVVLEKCRLRKRLAIIMVLEDETKAKKLVDFLNDGGYFESTVTVESFDTQLPNGTIVNLIVQNFLASEFE